VDPAVDAGLRCFQGLERRDVVQQLGSQALVEPLDLPVVVGDRGLPCRSTMPFSRQTRSNSTSTGCGRVCRPVNWRPLSS
jgi:hypothetical protein